MSLIGKQPVKILSGVTAVITKDNILTVKGTKGELKKQFDRDIIVEVVADTIIVKRPSDQKRHKALHGLTRSLIANMVEGVSTGFKSQLELVGVGFKATNQGQILDLSLGYSHNILFEVPKEVKVATEQEKGKNPVIILEGVDNELLGHICAKLRSLRKPEPYKGKGVKFLNEVLRRKAGKAAGGAK